MSKQFSGDLVERDKSLNKTKKSIKIKRNVVLKEKTPLNEKKIRKENNRKRNWLIYTPMGNNIR